MEFTPGAAALNRAAPGYLQLCLLQFFIILDIFQDSFDHRFVNAAFFHRQDHRISHEELSFALSLTKSFAAALLEALTDSFAAAECKAFFFATIIDPL